ncbi:MAG: 3'-5' exonuclease [Anaerolineales bacterium]
MQPSDHRQNAVRIAKEVLSLNPVYLDTETTGTSPMDLVIEVAVLDTDGIVLLESLVKSPKPIPPDATRVHGINDIHLMQAPDWPSVWPQLVEALQGRVLAVYNAEFDLRLLRQTCGLHGVPWTPPFARQFCIMKLFAQYYGDWNPSRRSYKWKSLDFAGKYFKLPEPNSHRATQDTLLSKLVLEAIANS